MKTKPPLQMQTLPLSIGIAAGTIVPRPKPARKMPEAVKRDLARLKRERRRARNLCLQAGHEDDL